MRKKIFGKCAFLVIIHRILIPVPVHCIIQRQLHPPVPPHAFQIFEVNFEHSLFRPYNINIQFVKSA